MRSSTNNPNESILNSTCGCGPACTCGQGLGCNCQSIRVSPSEKSGSRD